MKRNLIIFVLFSATVFACNNKSDKADKKTETFREVPVPNVNGNIPDTNNSIDLSTKKIDSTKKDSSSRH